MAASSARERRPALWPYLVMPLIVSLVFYALFKVHPRPAAHVAAPPAPAANPASG